MFLACLPDFESLDLACRTSQYPKAALSNRIDPLPSRGPTAALPARARRPIRPPGLVPDHFSLPLRSSCNRREDVIRKRLDVSCRLCPTFRKSRFAAAQNLPNSVRPTPLAGGRKPSCPSRSTGFLVWNIPPFVSGRTQSPRHRPLRRGLRRSTPWLYDRPCEKFRKRTAGPESDPRLLAASSAAVDVPTERHMVRYERCRLRQSESNVLFK
jgi:hypothetical protein